MTLEEAVQRIVSSLDDASKQRLLSQPQSDLVRYHHTWGQGIRNSFGLWGKNAALLADCGSPDMWPDEASMVIMRAVWNRLHDQPVADARIKAYRSFADRVRDAGPEEMYRRLRLRPSGKRASDQSIYKMLKASFEMSYRQFLELAARVDTADGIE